MNETDRAFQLIRGGNRLAFEKWLSMVESPLRRSLRWFARYVDTEVVLQETLKRMWMIGIEGRELQGDNASLQLAFGVMRNVRREEQRRLGEQERGHEGARDREDADDDVSLAPLSNFFAELLPQGSFFSRSRSFYIIV